MNKVDVSNALLNDALKQRQSFMYNLASTLADTPVQQGYGSWLSNLTNAFGRAYQGGIDSDIERQKAQDLSNALQSEKLSDAAKVAAIYGDTGLAQQLLTAQATNDYRQAQLEESRLNREFNRAIKEQELAQKAAEDEAQRQYYLDQLGLKRDELAGTQEYRQGQLDIQRAGLEQDAAKLAQQTAENEAQRAYLIEKLGTEKQLSQAEQDLKRAQLEQTGAYRNARLAQEQAKIDKATAQQKAVSDYYMGKNVDYSKLPIKILEQLAKEKEAQKNSIVTNIATSTGEGIDPEEFIKKYNTGGIIETTASNVDSQDNPTLMAKFVRSVVAPTNTGARSALAQNMTDKIIGPKIQNMIQTMGGARGADTLREISTRIGPLGQLTSLGTQEQLGAISAAKTDVLDIINRDRMAVGMEPLTMQEFQPAWNKLFSGIATYDKEYGEKEKKSDMQKKSSVEQKEDYSKYGF